jgi:hypothetical protein
LIPLSILRFLRRWPWYFVVLTALAFALLWLDIFSPPSSPVIPQLDISWSAALIHFAAEGFQFGKEVIFAYGPLSHLITFIYTGELFASRVVWELVSKTFFAAVLCAATFRLPQLWRLPFFVFAFLFVWADGAPDTLYFLAISCLVAFLFRNGPGRFGLDLLAGSFFAIASLIKFTYAILAMLALIFVLASCCVQRRPLRGLLLLLAFVVTLLLCWRAAGQSYRNLVPYFYASMDVSLHYKGAMSRPASSNAIVIVGAAAGLLGVLQCAVTFLGSRPARSLFFVLFLVSEIILVWNRALVRADDHVLSFFCLCPAILFTTWLVVSPEAKSCRVGSGINLIVLVLCLGGIALQRPTELRAWVPQAITRVCGAWHIVMHPNAYCEQLRSQLTQAKATYALPRVRAEVGHQTIDVFGHEQGIALLNDLNYRPRPAFQGYSAYSSALIDANTAHYTSRKAPEYVLFKYQTIDDRYPSLDDAGVLRQLLLNYKPLLEEQDYVLWKNIRPAGPIPVETRLTTSLPFDAELALPAPVDGMQWLQLEVKVSRLGRALNFFYKPPEVTLRVTDNLGRQTSYRLIPSMSSKGFLINPYLKSVREVLLTASGEQTASVTSFSVHVAKRDTIFFKPRISVRLSVVPKPPQSEMDDQARRLAAAGG